MSIRSLFLTNWIERGLYGRLFGTAIVLQIICGLSAAHAAQYVYLPGSAGAIQALTASFAEPVNVSTGEIDLAVHPDGSRIYVSDSVNNAVVVLDTTTYQRTATIPVGNTPKGIAINQAGTRLYVANFGSGTVSVIDASTNSVTSTVSVGGKPRSIAVHPDGGRVYVGKQQQSQQVLSVVDAATYAVTSITTQFGGTLSKLILNTAGTRLYASYEVSFGYGFEVIDLQTNTRIAAVNVGGDNGSRITWFGLNPAGSRIYLTTLSPRRLSVWDSATLSQLSILDQYIGRDYSGAPLRSDFEGAVIHPDGTKFFNYSGFAFAIQEPGSLLTPIGTERYTNPVAFSPVPACSIPANNRFVESESRATFQANCFHGPTSYRWTLNGVEVPGATTSFSPAIETLAGNYTVGLTASNSEGTSVQAVAAMRVFNRRDINSDGKADIIFQNDLGQVYVWYMDGSGVGTSGAFIYEGGLGDWRIVGMADLNTDGIGDIIFQHAATGQVYVWYMNGSGVGTSGAFIYSGALPDWTLAGAADLNGDGKMDLLFQQVSTGRLCVWYLNGAGAVTNTRYIYEGSLGDWKVVGLADLNSDFKADLLFQHAVTGQLFVWYMNGAGSVAGSESLYNGNLGEWKVAGTADLNSDGKPDILFQSAANGNLYVWYSSGNGKFSGSGYVYDGSKGGLVDWKARLR